SSSSLDTGNGMRDGHLKGHDFFQSQAHPEILFKSKKITRLSGNNYQAEGDLHIRGITKPATVAFSVSDTRKDTWGYQNRFVKFKSSLKRKDYNMTWNKTLEGQQFLVGDVV